MNYEGYKIEMITLWGLFNYDISNTGVIKYWFQFPTLIQLVKGGLLNKWKNSISELSATQVRKIKELKFVSVLGGK